MSKPFEGQVAVVTGAGRGIGEAIAKMLADKGASVAVISRTESNAGKTAEFINAAHPGAAKAYAVDVADFQAVQELADTIFKDFGKVDILVNNAGVTRDGLSMRMSSEDWDVVVDTNLKGAFNFIRAVQRPMAKQRSGRIINISSVSGIMGNAGQANYAASKAGLVGLARSLARELGSRSITVNVVAPGPIDTDMTAALGEKRLEELASAVPLGRTGTVDEIAGVVTFLASPAAAYITGAVIPVDGGLGMGH
jgi:3-oxoacyl-[acyl-carrier protein] reductase